MSQEITLTPSTKILLDTSAILQQLPASVILERALRNYLETLPREDREAIEALCGRAVKNRDALRNRAAQSHTITDQPKVIYDSTRFCFKRERIEPLEPLDEFRMITPVGVFQMSKADFYREFPNVVASESYKTGVYNYPKLPSKAERFRAHEITYDEIATRYRKRILGLLDRWREAFQGAKWTTTETKAGFEKHPTGHPVFRWSMNAEHALGRKAHIVILIEGETDGEPNGYWAVVNCLTSIDLGPSDHVKLDAPGFSVLLDDERSIEEKFRSLEQVSGTEVLRAIEQHVRLKG